MFYFFNESDKDLCEKIGKDMNGGPSFVIIRKTVLDETFIRHSSNFYISIFGIDASQLYPISLCQDICQRNCTRDESLKPICRILKPDTTNLAILRVCLCLSTRKPDQNAKLRDFSLVENQRK